MQTSLGAQESGHTWCFACLDPRLIMYGLSFDEDICIAGDGKIPHCTLDAP
jgi:hypothetical protein